MDQVFMMGAGGVTVTAAGAWLFSILRRYRPGLAVTAATPFSAQRYEVMQRLCSDADLQFLRKLPGFHRELEAKFRRERRAAFRAFLRELACDFRSTHAAARNLAVHAPEEHADLIGALLRQRVAFWRSLLVVEARLAVSWAGVPQMDLGELMESVDQAREALAQANRRHALHAV